MCEVCVREVRVHIVDGISPHSCKCGGSAPSKNKVKLVTGDGDGSKHPVQTKASRMTAASEKC